MMQHMMKQIGTIFLADNEGHNDDDSDKDYDDYDGDDDDNDDDEEGFTHTHRVRMYCGSLFMYNMFTFAVNIHLVR